MSDDRAQFRLKNAIGDIRDLEGRGTELITLYIPPDDNLQSWIVRLTNEYSQADNIKTDRTRDNVQDALKKCKNIIQQYSNPPENGLVIFVGHVDKADGFVEYVFDELPNRVNQSNYICDDHFHTEPIEGIVTPEDAYGLLVVTRDKATIGQLIGDRIDTIREIDTIVMGKSKAGGQSAARFERLREEQKHEHFKKTADAADSAFIEDNQLSVKGILIGGTDITVDDFTDNDYLDYRLTEGTLGTFNVAYGDETGLKQLVDKSDSVLQAHRQGQSKELVGRFFKALATDDKHATYGRENVERALEFGAVDTLLLSEELSESIVEELAEKAENKGGSVELVPTEFDEGEQLSTVFGGIAALLRYEV